MGPANKRKGSKPARAKAKRSDIERAGIEDLNSILANERLLLQSGPTDGHANESVLTSARKFRDLPISQRTKTALARNGFKQLTAIQRATLPHTLCGKDVLGAAKTGSGKTLAFLIPVVETLYRSQWSKLDGLGALVISPTRELGLQIFAELRKVGAEHLFSAGLLIGGKDVKEERQHINNMNILVCTPGRLLQHMDETPGFECTTVRILVLDEADRCMDMGFEATMNAIIANLPCKRQTLLFSATQSKRVNDLARLSITDAEFVAVHSEASNATPFKLREYYVTCPLHQKLDLLWFFIKTHQKKRTIVFLSTCTQVKFIYEAFRKLRPGVPLGMLHGKMKQGRRLEVFYKFNDTKAMVLFATDIAARGLDFPSVDWVVQADCPEDVAAYIHRVGRTARFRSGGEAISFLLPSEEQGMLAALTKQKVSVKQRPFAADKVQPVTPALTSLMAKSEDLKGLGQAAFVSYLRSVFLNPAKDVFDVSKLDAAEFAASLGLPTAPRLRMVQRMQKQSARRRTGGDATGQDLDDGAEAASSSDADVEDEAAEEVQGAVVSREAPEPATLRGSDEEAAEVAAGARASNGEAVAASESSVGGGDEDDDFLVVKRANVFSVDDARVDHGGSGAGSPEGTLDTAAVGTEPPDASLLAKRKKKMKIRPDRGTGQRTVFDSEGNALDPLAALVQTLEDPHEHASAQERFEARKSQMREADRRDCELAREKRAVERALRKSKAKARAASEAPLGSGLVTLATLDEGTPSGCDVDDNIDPNHDRGGRGSPGEADALGSKRSRGNAAYVGMQESEDEDTDVDDAVAMHEPKVKRARGVGASLSAQEDLALRLIASRATF